jgi:hypothetical protein
MSGTAARVCFLRQGANRETQLSSLRYAGVPRCFGREKTWSVVSVESVDEERRAPPVDAIVK